MDEVADATEYAYLTTKLGPLFYNIPCASRLTAMYGLEPKKAFEVFKAWEKARNWIHPNEDPKWLKRVEELEAKHARRGPTRAEASAPGS